MEIPGIDPGASHLRSERSPIWAKSPYDIPAAREKSLAKEIFFRSVKSTIK